MSFFHDIIVKTVSILPQKAVWYFSKNYIAGETLDDAIKKVKELNALGIMATLDLLGESVKNEEEAIEDKNEGLKVFDAIEEHNLDANLSIKPTQMGLSINQDFAHKQVLEVVKYAAQKNNFVRIDMEDSPYTNATIDLFKRIHSEYKNVGIVLQAYLKRTMDDTIVLNKIGTNYRLCKGIYIEPPTIAYKDKKMIRDNFLAVLKTMMTNGNYVGIATHDIYLIEGAYKLIEELNVPKDKFEFQMLLGVREDLRDKIVKDGYRIRIYVPYGKDWYAYSTRRLKENPNIAGHIVKEFFKIRR